MSERAGAEAGAGVGKESVCRDRVTTHPGFSGRGQSRRKGEKDDPKNRRNGRKGELSSRLLAAHAIFSSVSGGVVETEIEAEIQAYRWMSERDKDASARSPRVVCLLFRPCCKKE